ncbi:unnamed protein product, partial [Ectocarpus sp. 8 AP-2014]
MSCSSPSTPCTPGTSASTCGRAKRCTSGPRLSLSRGSRGIRLRSSTCTASCTSAATSTASTIWSTRGRTTHTIRSTVPPMAISSPTAVRWYAS